MLTAQERLAESRARGFTEAPADYGMNGILRTIRFRLFFSEEE